jgi:hypothetical protein
MANNDSDFRDIDPMQLSDLRNQLKSFVSGAVAECPIEEAALDAKCGSHSSHVDNDGWV